MKDAINEKVETVLAFTFLDHYLFGPVADELPVTSEGKAILFVESGQHAAGRQHIWKWLFFSFHGTESTLSEMEGKWKGRRRVMPQ